MKFDVYNKYIFKNDPILDQNYFINYENEILLFKKMHF